MEKGTLLVGEPMGLFIAQNTGPFEDVDGYYSAIAGAEFNVAIGIQRLGHPVGYYTKLGNDPFGRRIVKMMDSENISTKLIQFYDDRFTGFMLKSKVEKGDPQIFYFRRNSAASTLSAADIEKLDLASYKAIHMTGITPALSQSAMEATEALLRRAREEGMLYSFDPNLRPQLWKDQQTMRDYMNGMAGRCDIFMPGINEARILTGSDVPEKIAEFYLKKGCKVVTVKLGDAGAYYATETESGYVKGFKAEKVVDTVGAGDGFAAGLLTAYHEGLSWEECVRRGNAVGAIQVMSLGDNDGLPTRKELFDFMDGKPDWRVKGNEL
jgi:2-dehydro-3-deoxygluconokinase